jgi:hypothetical protein
MLAEFTEIPFPDHGDIVYWLCFRPLGASEFIPFYVGQSSRHCGRFGDYVSAKFSAATDFKVGKAVRKFRDLGCEVVVRYTPTDDRRIDEMSLIQSLRDEHELLNDVASYDYRTAVEEEELRRIEVFVQRLVLKTAEVTSVRPIRSKRNRSSAETIGPPLRSR